MATDENDHSDGYVHLSQPQSGQVFEIGHLQPDVDEAQAQPLISISRGSPRDALTRFKTVVVRLRHVEGALRSMVEPAAGRLVLG